MSFSKRSDTAIVCYTKPLDSLKHWNDSFFWVDTLVFPLSVLWHTKKTVTRDPSPTADEFSTKMDLFAFIRHADPTKVRIGKRQIEEGQVLLLESTRGRVIPLVSRNDREINMTMLRIVNIVVDEDVQDVVVGKPKGIRRKRKPAGWVSYSYLPPKNLRDDYGTSGDVGAKTAGKIPCCPSGFVGVQHFSFGSRCHESDNSKRFVISSDSSHHSSTNAADAELDSIVRDSASTGEAGQDVAGPSNPARTELSADTFYVCRSMVDQLAPPGEKKKFERKCNRQADLLKEKDVEIANLKAELYLKEAEAAEAIRIIEGQLSFNELNVKAASLESKKDNLANQVSSLETICSGLRDQISSYELFKEQYEEVQDEQVKVLSDQVAGLDIELMGMALHLDKEFYPHFLTTIVGRRWIISRGFRLAVMKCLQSLEYVAALGTAIGLAIDKGMQTGLAAGIDYGRARRSLTKKDAFIADIMSLLHLEGPSTETPQGIRLQPSYEQLFLPIHRTKDNAVIEETSLFDSLDVVYACVQKIKEGASSRRLSLWDVIGPLVELLSSENLVGEASTSGVPVTVVVTTALSTTFAQIGMLKLMMQNCMLKLLLLS
ncbi:hypothetical protein Tco_1090409 [Tanacetum coccineum]|uniref:Transposase (Putative), gypsy type n=1 Tax=Tanacetum coccineum TaxID=301880 RepID=A0ABQ5I438_9ASTR